MPCRMTQQRHIRRALTCFRPRRMVPELFKLLRHRRRGGGHPAVRVGMWEVRGGLVRSPPPRISSRRASEASLLKGAAFLRRQTLRFTPRDEEGTGPRFSSIVRPLAAAPARCRWRKGKRWSRRFDIINNSNRGQSVVLIPFHSTGPGQSLCLCRWRPQ